MRCRSFYLLLMLLCGMLPTPAIGQKLSAYSAARQTRLSSAQLRIDAALRQTSSLVKQYGSTAASRMVTRAVQLRQDGVMDVYVHVNPLTSTQLQMLRQHTIRIQGVDWQAHIVYASVSVDALETIAALDFVRWIGPPSYAKRRTGSVTSSVMTAGVVSRLAIGPMERTSNLCRPACANPRSA